ncbi:serine hydrolase [Paenibacillus sp. J22TS3]|uniref:serine hydrolase domain-containing protein n=1 Tax=Paenibacillus sp. J22TS3 TaxID=2807192 RepID=UPI001B2F2332|nr:serine hydrolase domain-containing protein [Paenibacillus sp. J22TS3]GIP20709.1 hypothetical protein J22TS3_09840 [Paenibacillus sp. J22TS3]
MNTRFRNQMVSFLLSVVLFAVFASPALASPANAAGDIHMERTPSGIPYAQLGQEIDKYVNKYIGKSSPGAAVVVTKAGKVIFSKGYGYANVEKQIPVDPATTVFNYGSINKVFVWTSVMQLVEQGKMKLDQDVKAYFPKQFADKLRYDKPVTMLDMMSHTAGFEQHPLGLFLKSPEKLMSLEDTLLSVQPAQVFEPGKVMAYSNYSTALAAFTVEKVSGHSFSDYEMNRILRPLGMNHTSGHPTLKDHPDLARAQATGYVSAEHGGFEPREHYYVQLYPAGAMQGTAEDLGRFAQALTSEHSPLFVKPETLGIMLSQSYTPHKDFLGNAHGLWEYNTKPHAVGHSGNTMGFSSNFAVVPDEQLGIVVLTNAEVEQSLTSGVIDLLTKTPKPETTASGENLQKSSEVAGSYVIAQNTFSTIQEFMSYLGLVKLEAKGEHDLVINVMGLSGEYTQVAPQVYRLNLGAEPRLQKLAPELYAEMQNGKVVRLSKGRATDIVPLGSGRAVPALLAYAAIAVTDMLFFLIAPLVLLVRWFLRKRKGRGSSSPVERLIQGVILCGSIIVINVLILLANVMFNQDVTAAQLNTGIVINWILAVLADLLLVYSVYIGRKSAQSKHLSSLQIITAVIINSYLILLLNWHFFHLIH